MLGQGCLWIGGAHYKVIFEQAIPTRNTDDTVSVSARIQCIEAGVECPEDLCVAAEWYVRGALLNAGEEVDGRVRTVLVYETDEGEEMTIDSTPDFEGTPIASASACVEERLRNHDEREFTLVPDRPLGAEEDLVIHLRVYVEGKRFGTEDELVLVNP